MEDSLSEAVDRYFEKLRPMSVRTPEDHNHAKEIVFKYDSVDDIKDARDK